jgi:hypothetical protein
MEGLFLPGVVPALDAQDQLSDSVNQQNRARNDHVPRIALVWLCCLLAGGIGCVNAVRWDPRIGGP